jgi:hypothetical protein
MSMLSTSNLARTSFLSFFMKESETFLIFSLFLRSRLERLAESAIGTCLHSNKDDYIAVLCDEVDLPEGGPVIPLDNLVLPFPEVPERDLLTLSTE